MSEKAIAERYKKCESCGGRGWNERNTNDSVRHCVECPYCLDGQILLTREELIEEIGAAEDQNKDYCAIFDKYEATVIELKAQLCRMTDERDAWQKAQQESFAAAAANADTCARLQEQVRVLSALVSDEELKEWVPDDWEAAFLERSDVDDFIAARKVSAQQKEKETIP